LRRLIQGTCIFAVLCYVVASLPSVLPRKSPFSGLEDRHGRQQRRGVGATRATGTCVLSRRGPSFCTRQRQQQLLRIVAPGRTWPGTASSGPTTRASDDSSVRTVALLATKGSRPLTCRASAPEKRRRKVSTPGTTSAVSQTKTAALASRCLAERGPESHVRLCSGVAETSAALEIS